MAEKTSKEFKIFVDKSLSNAKVIGLPTSIIESFILPQIEKLFSTSDLDLGFVTGMVDSIKINPELKLSLKYCLSVVQFLITYKKTKNLVESYNTTLGKIGCPSFPQAVAGAVTLFREAPHTDKYVKLDESELLYFTNHLEKLII